MNTNIINSLYLLPEFPEPPEAFKKAFKGLSAKLQGNAVPWNFALPEKVFNGLQKDIVNYKQEHQNLDLSYYENIFIPTNKVFDYLQAAKIDTDKYEKYLSLDVTGHIRSFQPDVNGFARPVEYNRISTVTGRLKTVSGPMLLHLPKIYRSVLKSRWNDGHIIALDYKSLEPRVLLAVNGTQPIEEEKDIYKAIKNSLFSDNQEISRDTIKKIVLSEIYGAGFETLKKQLPLVQNLEKIVALISEWFKLDILKENLNREWKSTNHRWITNYYGRRVKTENSHTLINHFIQSTAVDVALFGFKHIVEYIENIGRINDIIPMFILHDAIIFDIKQDACDILNGLCKIGSMDIKNLESTSFYMSIDKNFTLNN